MLPTLIQRYDKKNHFIFFDQFKNERPTKILHAVRCQIYDRINTIHQFLKPFLDNKKMSIFEEYGDPLSVVLPVSALFVHRGLFEYKLFYRTSIKWSCIGMS